MAKLKSVFFIVNANSKIGFGHLVRCVLLAQELKKRKINSTFLSFEVNKIKNIETQLFDHNQFENLESLFSFLIPKLAVDTFLVMDSDYDEIYDLQHQERILKTETKFMYISVKNNLDVKSHFLLNQNIIGLENTYNTSNYTKKLIGPNYFILNDSFHKIVPLSNKNKSRRLIITCGSADPNNVTEKVLDLLSIETLKFKHVDIVVGGGNKNLKEIKNHKFCLENEDSITIHHNTKNIYSIMKENDLAITTLGLTFWELVLHNIPCMLVSGSKREKEQIDYFCKNKYAYYLGDYDDRNWKVKWYVNFKEFSTKKINLDSLREKVNVNGKSLVIDTILNEYK